MTTATVTTLYGVFRSGGLRLALPLEELREVIRRPADLSPLPASGNGLLGAVNLRHIVIPVLDPCMLAGYPPMTSAGEVVVIVSSNGLLFGLLADAIEGSSHVAGDALFAVHVGGEGTALFSHTFERSDDRAVIALLDAAAILQTPGIPAVADPASQPGTPHSTVATPEERRSANTLLMFECGAIGLCIDVMHVHSVVPDLRLHASPLDGPTCRGVAHIAGKAIPAVDPVALLGIGHFSGAEARRGVVVALPHGLVILTASDVTDIAMVSADEVLPLPALQNPDQALAAGLLTSNGREYLMFDGDSLREDAALASFAALNMQLDFSTTVSDVSPPRRSGEDDGGRRFAPSIRRFLTYNAGSDVATPLDQIDEILPFPHHHLRLDAAPLVGLFSHRRASVPLIDLPALLSRHGTLDPDTARVLLVTTDAGDPVGLIVPNLHAIEQSVEEESDKAVPGGERPRLASIGTPQESRLLPVIDLRALATGFIGHDPAR